MFSLKRNILESSTTADQAHHLLALWQEVMEQALYRADTAQTLLQRWRTAVADIENEGDREILEQWDTEWLTTIVPEEFPDFASEMQHWLQRVPTFVVYVPVALDAAGVELLHRWVQQEMGEEWLLDLRVSANTLGGCAFIADEHWHDYSLHGQLQRQPEAVREALRSYETST